MIQNPSRVIRNFFFSLFDQVPGHSLVALRISWGVVMLSEVVRFMELDFGLLQDTLVSPKYLFSYHGFEWIWRCSLENWKVLLWIMTVSCVAFSVGFLYRVASVTFFLLFTFLFLQDATMYLNHYYLICILSGVFSCLPANRLNAIDPILKLAKHQKTVPYWTVFVCRLVISIVYIYAGIAKMNEDWIRGEPLLHWVPKRCRWYPSLCWLLKHPATAVGMSWCGLVFDTLCPFLFPAGGYYRILAFMASTFFHVSNMLLFNIGVFPAVMLAISMIYCDPDWPLQVFRLFSRSPNFQSPPSVPRDKSKPLTRSEKRTIFLIGAFTVIQVFLPIRHVLYPGNVVWNELGHVFSWRMKLRDKMGMTKFYVTPPDLEPSGDNSRLVKLERFLTEDQIKRMAGRPDMIFQTVDEIIRRYEYAYTVAPQVHVVSIGSVNYRADQFMLDPRINLANATRRIDYITPFVPRDCDSSCPYVVEELRKEKNRDGKYLPKKRMFLQYDHVGLSEAMEFFDMSSKRPMPESKPISRKIIHVLLPLIPLFAICVFSLIIIDDWRVGRIQGVGVYLTDLWAAISATVFLSCAAGYMKASNVANIESFDDQKKDFYTSALALALWVILSYLVHRQKAKLEAAEDVQRA